MSQVKQPRAHKRVAISKKLRFEVFKRDGFKCMYCGAEAPKAVLHADHVKPVAGGGETSLLNLITACEDCNLGKGARELSDDSALAKQRRQLDELHERREQMEMMLKWRQGLADISTVEVDAAREHFARVVPGWKLESTTALKTMRERVKKYGLRQVLEAIDTAAERYAKTDEDGRVTQASAQLTIDKVGGILHICNQSEDKQRLHYVKGILSKRCHYLPFSVMSDLEAALAEGVDVEDMVAAAKRTSSWGAFSSWLVGAMGI